MPDTKLKATEKFKGDVLNKTADVLKTQPEYIVKTIERFLADLK